MNPNLRQLLDEAFSAGFRARRYPPVSDRRLAVYDFDGQRRVIADLVHRGQGMPVAWEPAFDATYDEQEKLAIRFSIEIGDGRRPDPVMILEMAYDLYRAERDVAVAAGRKAVAA